MQEVAFAKNLAMTSCNVVFHGFENDGVQKEKRRSSPFIWTENASVQTKNCVSALSMMASKVSGSLIRQVFLLLRNGIHPNVFRVKTSAFHVATSHFYHDSYCT